MKSEKLIIEQARNGSLTCKYFINNTWKYLYSKYSPEKILQTFDINENADCIVMLGLGLGYELSYLKKNANKDIFVIENDEAFFHALSGSSLLDNVHVLVGESYKEIDFKSLKIQVIQNLNLMECDITFYSSVLQEINRKSFANKKVIVFDHKTIARDCADAFENIGYIVYRLAWFNVSILRREIIKVSPKYVFSVNFSPTLANICEDLQIFYISWTVDTPAYTLYLKENHKNKNSLHFVYDEKVVQELTSKGLKNIFYMPVAANVERLTQIYLSSVESLKFGADVSFVGSNGLSNEYSTKIKHHLTNTTKKKIEQIISQQVNNEKYILKDIVTDELLEVIQAESKLTLHRSEQIYLTPKEKLSFILGRYHSYLERTSIMKVLSETFNLKIYGDEGWYHNGDKDIINSYQGHAEHYFEMPKVFKASKININITRCFVETGLPMRVFDVLGSESFLVTNNKLDINRMFKRDSDLVVYRDLQDLKDIINYYLNHEKERNNIKNQGYETVRKYHTYEIRINEMMKIVNKFSL
ncbi:glycosyltransferase [Bacillus sp. Cr_A10]|uniref:glycosyltransferase family protein n=1 Tax=Bacillus sp. Cr_A10 TaxID=3033993 RepID=UPI0023DB5B95|nr:glycosyltransferase [Bacillus sp. Cr_A10]MDF2065819.1 glycosyltransferase [Bacillus sp. Cr_A10]